MRLLHWGDSVFSSFLAFFLAVSVLHLGLVDILDPDIFGYGIYDHHLCTVGASNLPILSGRRMLVVILWSWWRSIPMAGHTGEKNLQKCCFTVRAVDPDPHGSAFIFPPGSGYQEGKLVN